MDWSDNSSKLLVMLLNQEQGLSVPAVLDVESGVYQTFEGLPSEGLPSIRYARFFSDSRFIAIMTERGFLRLDTETGQTQPIDTLPEGVDPPTEFDIAPDDSWLCMSSLRIDSDIWMIEFEQ